jgi:uncharacterized repeat protein (TIGR02543 family)
MQLLAESNMVLASGTLAQVSVISDAATTLTFQLLSTGTDEGFRLQDPSGNRVDSTTPQSNPNVQYSVTASGSGGWFSYQINSPAPGPWTVILGGSNISESEVGCNLMAFSDSKVTLSPETDGLFNQGQDVVVMCGLADLSTSPTTPVLSATITATVQLPDGTTTTLTLFDDGLHNDGAPNDGVYAAVLPGVSEAGEYLITYQGTGQNSQGQALQRVANGAFSVSTEDGQILGDPVYQTVDTNGDGNADDLQVECWVNSQVSGTYTLSGRLVNAAGTLSFTDSEQFTTSGSGAVEVSLLFDLNEIRAAGGIGNLHIQNLQLFEIANGRSAWVDSYRGTSQFQVQPVTYTVIPSAGPNGTIIPNTPQVMISGSSISFTAAPAIGYGVKQWLVSGSAVQSGGTTYNLNNVTVSGTVQVTFTPITYTIATSSSPAVGGITSGGGTFNSGTTGTVVATPATGYTFVDWTESGSVASTSTSYQFTVTGNRTLVANFTPITYTIATSSSPPAGGFTSGGGTFNSGTTATVVATPVSGYTFVDWTEAGSVVSTSTSYQLAVTTNRTLVANFLRITYTIATSSSPAVGGGDQWWRHTEFRSDGHSRGDTGFRL